MKEFILKPWGYEYIVFETSELAIWCLLIRGGEETSLHLHEGKQTSLSVIQGVAKVECNGEVMILRAGDRIEIPAGTPHRTKALQDLILLETETPNNKTDLVRLNDKYGRTGNV